MTPQDFLDSVVEQEPRRKDHNNIWDLIINHNITDNKLHSFFSTIETAQADNR